MELNRIKYKVEDKIATIEMDSMKTYNAISWDMLKELEYCFDCASSDDEVNVIIIKGQKKAFCAGGDINEQKEQILKEGKVELPKVNRVWELSNKIRTMSKIVIASVSGVAAGAGANLALSCDFIISTKETKFIQSFANMSLTPDMGGVYLLAKDIGWHKTMDLIVNANPILGIELYQLGVVYEVTSDKNLDAATLKLAKRISNGPILSYRNSKKLLYEVVFNDYENYHSLEYKSSNELANSKDFKEAVTAFLSKRSPDFKGE